MLLALYVDDGAASGPKEEVLKYREELIKKLKPEEEKEEDEDEEEKDEDDETSEERSPLWTGRRPRRSFRIAWRRLAKLTVMLRLRSLSSTTCAKPRFGKRVKVTFLS